MAKKMIALVLLMFLAGCGPKATAGGYKAMLESYRGLHIDQLVSILGPPRNQYTFKDGEKLYSFVNESRSYYAEPIYPMLGLGFHHRHFFGSYHFGGYGARGVRYDYCETRVNTDRKGKILGYAFQGNACRALPATTSAAPSEARDWR